MRHLATVPAADGLQILWLLDAPAPITGETCFELIFSRIVLGLAWGTGAHVVVVGERVFEYHDRRDRFYVVLDEQITPLPHQLLDELVRLKDQYRVTDLFLPEAPPDLAQSVRELEGLSHYRENAPNVARERWPTFLDFDLTAAIWPMPAPSEIMVHQQLEQLLQKQVIDPKTEQPMLDKEGMPLPKLLFPVDLPILATQAGLRQGSLVSCTALWLAALGLERSNLRPKLAPKEKAHVHKPNPYGGY
jgi:hypothetical protein